MRLHKRSLNFWSLLVAGGLLFTAPQALAQEPSWYWDVGAGETDAAFVLGTQRPRHIDDRDQILSVAVGYQVARYLAVEAGYRDFGSFHGLGSPCRQQDATCIERLAALDLCVEGTNCSQVIVDLDTQLSGMSIAAVPQWPVSERFSLRGKVGVLAWDGTVRAPGFGRIEELSGEDLLLGLGAHYQLSPSWQALIEIEDLDLGVRSRILALRWRL